MRILIFAGALLLPAGALAQDPEDDPKSPLPLPPDRTLAIDMTVGSWISLDVSPDGRTIVFDHLGNLFTVPITGGDATQLTSGMAFDAQPRFSPDGTRIVFTSDRSGGQNVWIMSLDGSDTTQVTKGASNRTESPEWSPDGDYIVASKGGFRGGGLPKLSLYHVDGGSGVQLIGEPDNLKTLGAAFDPSGRYIWYARRTSDWTYNAQFPQYQLAVYDRETGENYTRTSRYGSGVRPTLSPDGRWLVYGTRHDFHTGLRIRDLESGDERWLAYPVQHDDQESRATLDVLPGMSFTPDSRHLVASYGGKIWKLDVIEGGAEEIPFRVQYDLELGPLVEFDYPIEDTPTFTVRQIRDAVPSPDGARIAFTAVDRLWVANADGTDPNRLTEADHSEHYPAWSPAGDWIAYATWDGEAGHLHKVRADGRGSPVRLTERGAVYITPAWSPAGNRLVALRSYARDFRESAGGFGSGAPQPGEIVWVADGDGPGAATLIAPVDGRRGPHFAEGAGGAGPSADRIYFQRGDMLVSIRWDGTDERDHVRICGRTPPGSQAALSPQVLRMAPRGDLVMALIQQQVYTATVPRVGGEAPLINVGNPASAQMPARRLAALGARAALSTDCSRPGFCLQPPPSRPRNPARNPVPPAGKPAIPSPSAASPSTTTPSSRASRSRATTATPPPSSGTPPTSAPTGRPRPNAPSSSPTTAAPARPPSGCTWGSWGPAAWLPPKSARREHLRIPSRTTPTPSSTSPTSSWSTRSARGSATPSATPPAPTTGASTRTRAR